MIALIVVAWLVVATILKFNQDREYARQNLLTPFGRGFLANLLVIIPGTEILKLLGLGATPSSLLNIFIMIGYLVLVNMTARHFGAQDRNNNPPDSQDPPSEDSGS